MDLSGTVTFWSDFSLHFVGKGRAGSAIFDFEYEYDCRLAHEWDSASPPQRVSLVGTVRRNKDHSNGQAKAGVTASFIAVKRDFVEPRDVPGVSLIPEAVAMLSERAHRLRHTVWHTLRGDWQSPNMMDADRSRLRALGWYLTDPPFTSGGVLDLTNGAGEDFLYMHRRMIGMVHEVYDKAGQPPTSWKQIPAAAAQQFAYREAPDPTNPAVKIYVLDPDNSGEHGAAADTSIPRSGRRYSVFSLQQDIPRVVEPDAKHDHQPPQSASVKSAHAGCVWELD